MAAPSNSPAAGVLDAPPPLADVISLVGLGLVAWGAASEAHLGLGGRHLAAAFLLVGACAGWVLWVVWRRRGADTASFASLALMAICGGALTAYAPTAVVFVGVAALGATIRWPLPTAAFVVAASWGAMLITATMAHTSTNVLIWGIAAGLAGTVLGVSRRQSVEYAAQGARVAVEQERASLEHARAELLAERNHLARELHDVLAHTLAALSIQLEALDVSARAEDAAVKPELLEQIAETKRLVRESLDEARGAVGALRESSLPLPDQLAKLAADQGADFAVSGEARAIPPRSSLALFRAAQEGLTNTMKHAPGAHASITLEYRDESVAVSVTNDMPPAGEPRPLAASGGGYGLDGVRERLLLVGGNVEAGPSGSGWRLAARVPA